MWAIYGLIFFRASPQQHVSRRDSLTLLFAVSVDGANILNKVDNRRKPTTKKENRYCDSLVGHLGLEICLFKRDPLTSLFAVSAAGANEDNEVNNRR